MKVIAIKFFRWNYKGTTHTFRENEEIKNISDDAIKEMIIAGYAKYFEANKELPIENKRAEIEDKKVFTKPLKSLVTRKKKARRGRPPKKKGKQK